MPSSGSNDQMKQMMLFMSYIVSHDDIEEISKFHLAYIDQAVCIKSLYEALYLFCDAAGLNKNHVMSWLGIDPKPIFEFIGEKTLAMIEQDNELTEHLTKRFLAFWNGNF